MKKSEAGYCQCYTAIFHEWQPNQPITRGAGMKTSFYAFESIDASATFQVGA
jgi:hypothetical protein